MILLLALDGSLHSNTAVRLTRDSTSRGRPVRRIDRDRRQETQRARPIPAWLHRSQRDTPRAFPPGWCGPNLHLAGLVVLLKSTWELLGNLAHTDRKLRLRNLIQC